MNKEKVNKVFSVLTKTLRELQGILAEDTIISTNEDREASSEAINLLANRLAYAYTTRHPEYKVESQINNLKEMINSSKISYILSWLRRGNTSGIEGFLNLDVMDQRILLEKAVNTKEDEIKNIFNDRFKCK